MADENDAFKGLGRAVMVCIAHLQHSTDGTAGLTYHIELEGGEVQSYDITVRPVPSLVMTPENKNLH